MKYQLVDHDDGDKKYVLDWQESTPPDDEAIQGILAENRQQPKPQAAPQAPTAPKSTELPPGAISFDPNAKFQPEAVEHVAAKDKATADLLGAGVPFGEKPLEQQITEEYKTPTLEVPRQVANQYRVKGTTPGSIEWFNKLPDEHKDAVKPYMSAKDQAKVEGMEQDGAEAFMQSSANAESFGMLNKQGAALAEVRHPNIAAAGQLAGTLVDFMPEGSAVHLAAQLPRIAARAKSYGRVGGVIANAVTAGTTMGLDAMIRNKDDLSSPIPEVADKAQKNILNQIEYGVLAVAPSMAKVAGWSHRVAQGALYMLMSAKDDPEAFKKENIGQTFGAAVTMAILGGKGHEARAREAPKLDEATGQPIQDKTIIPEEEFDLSRFAPKPEGKEVPDAEKEKRQEGETHAEAGITTPEIPISGQEKKDVQGSQAQAAPVLTPEQRVQLDELRKQNAPPPPVDPDKPEPHPDQGTWDKNNSAIDFFRNNGYIYDEEKKRYVPENIPGDAEKYWASFGRFGPEYTRPDVDDKETRAKSRSLGREAGQSEEALTKSGRQAPLPGSEAGGVAPVEGQGRSGEPVGASQPEVRRVPRKPQTWTGNPEVDREAWSANLKSKLREEILNQPGGKQQWDYVMGKKTRDKNNNPIHYTNLTSKLLHDTYDYYETTEGRQGALKILGKSENPFSDFEDVASVAQGAKHPFEVHRMMQAERKNPTTPGEKKMTDAEAQEYERYMRAQDEAVGAHRVDLGGGDVAFAKAEKGQTEKKAIEHFGLTDNPREAGYLLEDGKMLDFSGRHEAAGYENKKPKKGEPDYLANERVVDHRQVQEIMKSGGWQAVEDFTKDSGVIRFMVVGGDEINLSIQDFQNPTETQWAKIARTQRELGGNTITYDIINEGGYTVEGGNAKSVLEIKTALKKAKAAAAGEGGQTSLFAKQDRTGFFSNAEAAVDKINMPKAPAEQWLKMLDPAKGVGTKADEMKWIGLDDFLKEKGNQSVAKQEIQDFIDQNKVKLEEVKKGKEPFKSPLTEEESDRMEELGLMENHTSEEADEYNKLSKKFKLEKDKWLEAGEGTKFASYQIPGGSNYRELLMTLPTIDKKLSPAEMKELEKLNFATRRTPEDEKRLDELIAKGTNNRPDLGYKSSHWDEPNVLAHVRVADHEAQDESKVYLMEENQSDLHQEGRKKGYIGELPKGWKVEEFTPELGDNKYQVLDEQGQQMGSGKTKEEAIRISNRQGQVPAAPFSKTWHELVFKRALRDAVEGGYDKFAWTTGEQQAARYDLTKNIGKAIWNEDTKMLTAYDPSMEKTVLQVDIKSPQELENYIGKDAAQKLIDAKPDTEMDRTISGLDLKVGGEGMKGFYDKILVDYANKYGKKWGAKAGSVKLKNGETVHSMDITPAMRESVMREGQPMFAKGTAGKPKYNAKTLQPILNRIAPKGLVIAVDGEEGFPQNVRDKIKAQRFEGQIMGTYDGLSSKLFINAEHMPNEASIRKYVKHELTHLGLRISLGKQIEPIYKTLYGKYKNFETGKAIISNYFSDGFHPEEYWNHKITFVDEVLAKLGETNVDPGFFRRMVARIKVMLNSRFPGMKFSDKDVRAMIANAHRDAEKFGKKLEDLPEGHQLQYDADTKKWAVLNAKGETVNEDADRTKAIAFAKGEDHNGEGAGIAKKLGVRFDGIQEGAGKVPERYAFTDAKTGSSFVGKDEEEARKRFEDMKTRFAAPEVAFALKGKDPEEVLDNIPKTPPRSLPSKPMAGIFGALKALHTKVTSIEGVYSPFKKTLLEWDSKNQQLAQKATNAVNYVKKFVPDKARRDAISVYREAGGDKAVLRKWAQETPQGKLQGKYVLALNLTDQEKKVADGITELYQKLLERGQKYGLIDQARMNYVTHLVQRGDAVGKEAMKGLSSGKLVSAFKFGRESDFPTIHDAEQALGTNDFGQTFRYKVATSDAADLMGIYISEMEKTINTKDLIKNLTEQKAKDGRPLAVPAGAVKSSVNGETGDKTLVVKPREVDKDYSDYRGVDHYALNDWKWIGKDTGGNPVTIKGDLVLHPDIVKHVKNVLGSSGIRDWYNNPPNVFQAIPAKILKTVDNWQNNTKQAMFSVSAFHWVQEGTHAIGHRVNPFKVPTIDLEGNKDHIDAADHGLKLKGDYDGMAAFREGLGVGPLMYKIPGIGKLLEKSSEPLFTWYIPGLKYKTYEHILGRNMTRFEKEIQAGKVTADDVKYVSAKQANAAYGHLNYVDMGRNPTIQHLFRMFTLAPDFLEARTRFAAQAVGGTISKGGREQLEALAVLAVTQYVACRIINKLADDDYHMDQPFKVVIGTKTYGLRSVPGDLYHLYQNHNQFVQGRISPVLGKSVEHLLTGRDYRGLPQSDLSFLKEVATSALPISLRAAIPGMSTNKDVNAYDSFLSATGIGVSRYSPLTCMYDMVDKWKASQGITKQEAVYPPAKFRDLRNAVQDGEEGGVYKHWDELLKGGKIHTTALKEHFRQSLFRPFTGSEKTEKAFRRSLSPEDRKIYDVAVMDKQRTWKNFLKIMGERPVQDKGQEKTVQSDTTQAQEGENHGP